DPHPKINSILHPLQPSSNPGLSHFGQHLNLNGNPDLCHPFSNNPNPCQPRGSTPSLLPLIKAQCMILSPYTNGSKPSQILPTWSSRSISPLSHLMQPSVTRSLLIGCLRSTIWRLSHPCSHANPMDGIRRSR